jgi:hypothetical protein
MRTGTNELSEALARLQRDQSMHAVIRDLLGETEHFRLIGQAELLQFFLEILEKALKIRVRAPVSSKWSRPRPPQAGVVDASGGSESSELCDRPKILEIPRRGGWRTISVVEMQPLGVVPFAVLRNIVGPTATLSKLRRPVGERRKRLKPGSAGPILLML